MYPLSAQYEYNTLIEKKRYHNIHLLYIYPFRQDKIATRGISNERSRQFYWFKNQLKHVGYKINKDCVERYYIFLSHLTCRTAEKIM